MKKLLIIVAILFGLSACSLGQASDTELYTLVPLLDTLAPANQDSATDTPDVQDLATATPENPDSATGEPDAQDLETEEPTPIPPTPANLDVADKTFSLSKGDAFTLKGEGRLEAEIFELKEDATMAINWIQSSEGVFIFNIHNLDPLTENTKYGMIFLESVRGKNSGERIFFLAAGHYYIELPEADGDWEINISAIE